MNLLLALLLAANWPSYLGPNGNFSENSDAKLLDDITQARLVWQSEEKQIGFGKAHTGAAKGGLGPEFGGLPPGGEASPIVVGGLVIQSYFVPRGDVWDADIAQRMGAKFQTNVWLVAVDDVVIAMDAATGKTRWKQVFTDKGINTGANKRGGWAATPCAADGKVFALGTTGRLYALDLATGKPLWQSDIGVKHQEIESLKAKGLANRRLALTGKNFRPYAILVVAGGVLLAPDWNSGLLGFDPATGKQLWHLRGNILSGFNAPAPRGAFVACVNRLGELRLIEVKTGKVLWTQPLKCEHLTQPVFGKELLIVFESNPKHNEGKQEGVNQVGVLTGYRNNQRVWTLPAEYAHELKLDAGPSRRVICRDGLVYYLARSKRNETTYQFLIIREADGVILKSQPVDANQFYLWGDRVITVSDLQHRPRQANAEAWQMYTTDLHKLGAPWHINAKTAVHVATGGYELPVYEAFADGLFYARVMGGIRCYDLRATH